MFALVCAQATYLQQNDVDRLSIVDILPPEDHCTHGVCLSVVTIMQRRFRFNITVVTIQKNCPITLNINLYSVVSELTVGNYQ